MRLPWVSQSAYDTLREERDYLRIVVDAERYRNDALVEAQREMQREGFAPPARPDQLVPVDVDLPDGVHTAIGQRAAPNSELERELRKWAATMQRQGLASEKIEAAILRGGHVDEEDDEA